MIATTTAKLIAGAALLGLVVLLILAGPAAYNRIRGLEAQQKVNQGQSAAFHNSAGDAINTISETNRNETSRADQARHDTEEITNAKGASTATPADVYSAGLRAHCRRPASANDPKCRVLRSNAP